MIARSIFVTNDKINNIIPYHTQLFPDLAKEKKLYIQPAAVIGSSFSADDFTAEKVIDGSYGTRWEPADEDKAPVVIIAVDTMEVRMEYPWEKYFMKVETSSDDNTWKHIVDYTTDGIAGSPVNVPVNDRCKFVRLSFTTPEGSIKPSIWEIVFY